MGRTIDPPPVRSDLSRRMLRRSQQHAGSDLGWARVFQALEAGRPIRALAFGTSVTGVGGGCTHSMLPYCDSCCGTRVYGPETARRQHGRGFLRMAFDWMNNTWPHADHRLYNSGRPGAGGLVNFIGCLSSWVPEAIDLFFLEVGGTDNSRRNVERLVRLLYRMRPSHEPPAFFVIDMWNYRWPRKTPPTDGFFESRPALELVH